MARILERLLGGQSERSDASLAQAPVCLTRDDILQTFPELAR
ncbi:hypothetical protein [Palleronia pelagia]|uniref:Uncharacterized protein n=1 Tax=Palleronia pelagia TaxID=387096 RepID=A0A1H8EV38_9RHOB|nr:hypothetical protein [Palleronia pelagia]SEN23339.1 hypothetical protein SAMN04488011_103111 [Palleronia pelagia]